MTSAGFASGLFRFSYALYLIDHHDALPKRLLKRLRNPDTFRPAALETLVVAAFTLAGFSIRMGETTKRAEAEAEFVATLPDGKFYSVEAKCKNAWSSSTVDFTADDFKSELRQWLRQKIYAASTKNLDNPIYWLELSIPEVDTLDRARSLQDFVRETLKDLEGKFSIGGREPAPAYVFVTCYGFLVENESSDDQCIMLEGFRILMHRNGDVVPIEEAFDERDRDRDVLWVLSCFQKVQSVPHSFDGTPDVLFGPGLEPISRLKIGSEIELPTAGGEVVKGIICHVSINADRAMVWINDDNLNDLRQVETTLTKEEIFAFTQLGPLAFGDPDAPEIIEPNDILALYDILMRSYGATSRDKLLSFLERHEKFTEHSMLDTESLRKRVCREWTKMIVADAARSRPGGKIAIKSGR